MLIRIYIMLLCLVMTGCVTEKPEDPNLADKILTRFVEISGGQKNIGTIHTRIIKGVWTDDRSYRGAPLSSEFTVYAHADGRWRYSSEYEVYGVDATGGWWMEKGYLRSASGQKGSKMEFLVLPQSQLDMERYFQGLKYGRKGKQNGRAVTGLFSGQDTSYYALWFDDDSGDLVRIGHYWSLLDYREIDGIIFPYRIEKSRKGGVVILQVDSVVHNLGIPDSLLARPTNLPSEESLAN